jgi:uncharacterized protein (DUF1778 family)
MEEKDRQMLTFQVSAEEAETIGAAARQSGLSRSDYIRQRLLNLSRDSEERPETRRLSNDPIALLHQVLYGLQRIIAAQYRIPLMAGTLSAEQLEIAGAHTIQKGTVYLANLDAGLAKTRQQVTAYLTAPEQLSAAKVE